MLRPALLTLITAPNQPFVRRDNGLVGDDDEASRPDEDAPQCSTLPRAFPATWYRVEVTAPAAPQTARSTFPPLGRIVFDDVTFHEGIQVDRYVYAIDRTYGNEANGNDPHGCGSAAFKHKDRRRLSRRR